MSRLRQYQTGEFVLLKQCYYYANVGPFTFFKKNPNLSKKLKKKKKLLGGFSPVFCGLLGFISFVPTLVCAGQRKLDTARAVGILLPYQLPRLLLSLLSHHEQGQLRALGDLKYVQEVVTHLYSNLV